MYKKLFDKYNLIKIFCFIMLPHKQWPFILTSNLLFTKTVCNERVPKRIQDETKHNRRSSIEIAKNF